MALVTNNISGSSSDSSKIGITGSVIISNSGDAQFPSIGSDAVLFVSGSETAKSVFGGAAKISGSLSTDGNVTLGNSSDDILIVSGTSQFVRDVISSTDIIASGTLKSLNSTGDEGGEVFLSKPVTNTTLNTGVTIDVYQDRVRIFETGGTNRGGYYDISALSAGVGTNLASGGGSGAPTGAQYVTLATNASLTDERVLTAGSGISITDGGAGSTVTISATGTSDPSAQYLVLASTSSLSNERTFTPGTGLTGTDGGANSNYVLAINDSVVATVSGTSFTGPISSTGFTSTDRVLITSGSSRTISQAGALIYDSTNQYLGIGTTPSRNVHVANGFRLGSAGSYVEWVGVNSTTTRITVGGTQTTLEMNQDTLFPPNKTIGFQSALASAKDSGFSRAAAGIINVSGSAPGALFRFNASSTPLSAGDLGMNTSSGRPNALISGSVRQLAHIDEVALLAGAQFTGNVGITGSLSTTDDVGIGTPPIATARLLVSGTSTGTDTTLMVRHGVAQGSSLPVFAVMNSAGSSLLLVSGSGATTINGNTAITGTFGINSSVTSTNTGVLFQSGGVIRTDSFFVFDNVNKYLGIGNVGTLARSLQAFGGIRLGSSTNYLDLNMISPMARTSVAGTITFLELDHPVTITQSNKLSFTSFAAQTADAAFSRAAAGIISVSGSAPGALFRFNASSTPASAGDLGMNTTTGRPNALIGGSVRELAHVSEIAPSTASYVVIGLDSSLPNDRVLTAGSGISITDGGAGSTITISATGGGSGGADAAASYVVLSATSSLSNERVLAAGSGISITDGGPGGSVTIAATGGGGGGGDTYFSSTTAGSIFTSGSAAFKGNEFVDSPANKGTDVFFYVSGSTTQKALFGGDVRVSGSLTVGTGSIILTSNDIQFGSSTNRLELSGSKLKLFDGANTSGITLGSDLILVESKYITGDTQTITFSNLDGDRDRAYYLIMNRAQGGSTTSFEIRPNGTTSNLLGYYHFVSSAGPTHSVGSYGTSISFGGSVPSGSFGTLEVVFSATRFSRSRVFNLRHNYVVPGTPSYNQNSIVGVWSDTSTLLTSLDIYGSTSSAFLSGTHVHLYKLRNA